MPVPADIGALLLVTPPISMSTAAVFARFDEIGPTGAIEARANDLWPAAVSLAPSLWLPDAEELERAFGRPWLMSGSGSTLFAIFESGARAVAGGRAIVASESEALGGALINAVDLIGPDPLWRYP